MLTGSVQRPLSANDKTRLAHHQRGRGTLRQRAWSSHSYMKLVTSHPYDELDGPRGQPRDRQQLHVFKLPRLTALWRPLDFATSTPESTHSTICICALPCSVGIHDERLRQSTTPCCAMFRPGCGHLHDGVIHRDLLLSSIMCSLEYTLLSSSCDDDTASAQRSLSRSRSLARSQPWIACCNVAAPHLGPPPFRPPFPHNLALFNKF